MRPGRSDQRCTPAVPRHRKRLLPRGGHHREELLPTDAQKKTSMTTLARVLTLLQQALSEEEYSALCRAYVEAIVEDWGE